MDQVPWKKTQKINIEEKLDSWINCSRKREIHIVMEKNIAHSIALKNEYRIRHALIGDILGISCGYLVDILGIYGRYLWHILGNTWGYLLDIFRISLKYLGDILNISSFFLPIGSQSRGVVQFCPAVYAAADAADADDADDSDDTADE